MAAFIEHAEWCEYKHLRCVCGALSFANRYGRFTIETPRGTVYFDKWDLSTRKFTGVVRVEFPPKFFVYRCTPDNDGHELCFDDHFIVVDTETDEKWTYPLKWDEMYWRKCSRNCIDFVVGSPPQTGEKWECVALEETPFFDHLREKPEQPTEHVVEEVSEEPTAVEKPKLPVLEYPKHLIPNCMLFGLSDGVVEDNRPLIAQTWKQAQRDYTMSLQRTLTAWPMCDEHQEYKRLVFEDIEGGEWKQQPQFVCDTCDAATLKQHSELVTFEESSVEDCCEKDYGKSVNIKDIEV